MFISDGFLGNGQGVFNQLDVLLRHELAHNLMMHQIRLMYVFKKLHASDPDNAYEHIRYSASLHEILNIIEDFEISNKRYTSTDKKIVKTMQLNGQVISGLVTEDHRQAWENLSVEAMYDELSQELIKINSEIRSDPLWAPIKDGTWDQTDLIKLKGRDMINLYADFMSPSAIRAPLDVFIKSKTFSKYAKIYQELITSIYSAFKDFTSDSEKQAILDIVKDMSLTGPQEKFPVLLPTTGEVVCIAYTPEDKVLASAALKNLGGNINYDPLRFNIKKKVNSKEYKDAWNAVVKTLDKKQFDDDTLKQLRDAIGAK